MKARAIILLVLALLLGVARPALAQYTGGTILASNAVTFMPGTNAAQALNQTISVSPHTFAISTANFTNTGTLTNQVFLMASNTVTGALVTLANVGTYVPSALNAQSDAFATTNVSLQLFLQFQGAVTNCSGTNFQESIVQKN
jgi:hypothetical protein